MHNLTVTIDELCKICDVSKGRISQLITAGVIPKQERNRYEVVPVVNAYVRFLRERTIKGDTSDSGDYSSHRTRLTKAKADLAEMEREQLASDLIPANDARHAWSGMVANARTRLIAIPSKIAPLVVSAESINEAQDIIKNEIYEALQELADTEIRTINPIRVSDSGEDDEEGSQDMDASTEPYRQ
jgi:phage terminase Nu1 subunit (DNA packaging protein)